jgi:hypothetical protein
MLSKQDHVRLRVMGCVKDLRKDIAQPHQRLHLRRKHTTLCHQRVQQTRLVLNFDGAAPVATSSIQNVPVNHASGPSDEGHHPPLSRIPLYLEDTVYESPCRESTSSSTSVTGAQVAVPGQ